MQLGQDADLALFNFKAHTPPLSHAPRELGLYSVVPALPGGVRGWGTNEDEPKRDLPGNMLTNYSPSTAVLVSKVVTVITEKSGSLLFCDSSWASNLHEEFRGMVLFLGTKPLGREMSDIQISDLFTERHPGTGFGVKPAAEPGQDRHQAGSEGETVHRGPASRAVNRLRNRACPFCLWPSVSSSVKGWPAWMVFKQVNSFEPRLNPGQ